MSNNKTEFVKYAGVFILLIIAALGSTQVLKIALGTKYPLMVVVSKSMVPTLGVGDFIFVKNINNFESLIAAPQPEGDIIVFFKSASSEEYIVHRAIEKIERDNDVWFMTKGDNNPIQDSTPVPESRIIGKVVGRIPIIGYFPLFIKTSRGLVFIAILMVIVFFADFLMPKKMRENKIEGARFSWIYLLPYLAAPVAYIFFWFQPSLHLEIDLISISLWYIGCFTAPLAFNDDDLCLMFWLYHFVLLMIPLGWDIIWLLTDISPSMWWYAQGSTVPLTWLLMKETPLYRKAFLQFSTLLLPGCFIFLFTLSAKRRGSKFVASIIRKIKTTDVISST